MSRVHSSGVGVCSNGTGIEDGSIVEGNGMVDVQLHFARADFKGLSCLRVNILLSQYRKY